MERSTTVINLNDLARTHSTAVEQMISGIGSSSADLWTAQMRNSVRGGKAWAGPRFDDQFPA